MPVIRFSTPRTVDAGSAGRRCAAKSSNASTVVKCGWYPARSINLVVSSTRPVVSDSTCRGEKPPSRAVRITREMPPRVNAGTDSGSRPARWMACASVSTPSPATFTTPEKSFRARCSITPTASDSCTSWIRASRPSTIGTNGDSAK